MERNGERDAMRDDNRDAKILVENKKKRELGSEQRF
jgi:hypothetical protein